MFYFTAKCQFLKYILPFFIKLLQQVMLSEGEKKIKISFALHPFSHVTHLGHLLLAHGRMEEMFLYAKGVW